MIGTSPMTPKVKTHRIYELEMTHVMCNGVVPGGKPSNGAIMITADCKLV